MAPNFYPAHLPIIIFLAAYKQKTHWEVFCCMTRRSTLKTAKQFRNDEFYTRLIDIEDELSHYGGHFRGKIVYCNCDDPTRSNFWRYFHLNFTSLGLKKLISTHYDPKHPSYKMEYTGGDDSDIGAGVRTDLAGDGDFRSRECIEILMESDIVVTNAPFSLWRDHVAQLIEYRKKFLIIGNVNAITYKDFFPLLKENKAWSGYAFNRKMLFSVPEGHETTAEVDGESGTRSTTTTTPSMSTRLRISRWTMMG